MANDCYNYLTVQSPNNTELLSYILNDEGEVDYNILLPVPTNHLELAHAEREGCYLGERDWQWTNLGCPGVPHDTEIQEQTDEDAFITFTSEWAPPTLWFGEVAKQARKLDTVSASSTVVELEYCEHDEQFAGVIRYHSRQIEDKYYTKTSFKGEELAEALGLPELANHL